MTADENCATLGQCLVRGARERPDVRLVINEGGIDREIALAEVADRARRLAAGLKAIGLRSGDVFAVQMPTRLSTLIAHAAAGLLGLTLLPIIHIYEGRELDFIIDQSGARALLTPSAWRTIDFAARRAALAERFPDLIRIVDGDAEPGAVDLASLLDREPLEALPGIDPDAFAMLIYTSGTTADPKGVQHSHRSLIAELTADAERLDSSVKLSPWPPGHIAGVLGYLRFWALAQPSVLMEQWDAAEAARLIEQYRVRGTSGTPFHLLTLLDAAEADGRDISSLTDYMAGGTMVPPALIERCERIGLATYRCYGLSEHPTVSAGSPTDPLEKRLGTDGRLYPGVEVRIVDEEGSPLPVGETGEILTRGPDRFVGYRDKTLDAGAFTPDGWLQTGDIGRLDEDGFLAIVDRKKDIIIRGGENIASREVEDVLSLLPGVREAAVVGAPDERLGERVCAFIVADPGADLSIERIAVHFAEQGLAKQKTPEFVHRVDELPRNAAGKVLKPKLRDLLGNAA
jgi:acyl-CoA synthetase (AMP-forming)/AMP-acid ligase II